MSMIKTGIIIGCALVLLIVLYTVYGIIAKDDPKVIFERKIQRIEANGQELFSDDEALKTALPYIGKEFVAIVNTPFDPYEGEGTSRWHDKYPRLLRVRFESAWPADLPRPDEVAKIRPELANLRSPKITVIQDEEIVYEGVAISGAYTQTEEEKQQLDLQGFFTDIQINMMRQKSPVFKLDSVVWNHEHFTFQIDNGAFVANAAERYTLVDMNTLKPLGHQGAFIAKFKAANDLERRHKRDGFTRFNRGVYFRQDEDNRLGIGRIEGLEKTVELKGFVLHGELHAIGYGDENRKPHHFRFPLDTDIPGLATLYLDRRKDSGESFQMDLAPFEWPNNDAAKKDEMATNYAKLGDAPRSLTEHPLSWSYYLGDAINIPKGTIAPKKEQKSKRQQRQPEPVKTPSVKRQPVPTPPTATVSIENPQPEPPERKPERSARKPKPRWTMTTDAGWYEKKPKRFGIAQVEYGQLELTESELKFSFVKKKETIEFAIPISAMASIDLEKSEGRERTLDVFIVVGNEHAAQFNAWQTKSQFGKEYRGFIGFRIEKGRNTANRKFEELQEFIQKEQKGKATR